MGHTVEAKILFVVHPPLKGESMNGATQDGGWAARPDMSETQNGRWLIRQKPWVAKQQRISQFAAAFVPYIGCEVKNDGREIPRNS
jgi:hypothetical protein